MKMSSSTAHSRISLGDLSETGVSRFGVMCKQILNDAAMLVNRPIERRRLAALTPRMLDDVGMTAAERDAQLG
jgi:ribosome-associated protein YbcJ (S4-like RNA binding protein)